MGSYPKMFSLSSGSVSSDHGWLWCSSEALGSSGGRLQWLWGPSFEPVSDSGKIVVFALGEITQSYSQDFKNVLISHHTLHYYQYCFLQIESEPMRTSSHYVHWYNFKWQFLLNPLQFKNGPFLQPLRHQELATCNNKSQSWLMFTFTNKIASDVLSPPPPTSICVNGKGNAFTLISFDFNILPVPMKTWTLCWLRQAHWHYCTVLDEGGGHAWVKWSHVSIHSYHCQE